MVDDLYNAYGRCRGSVIYRTVLDLWKKYHCKDVSAIPEIDRQKMEILFSDKTRAEIIKELKEIQG